MRWARYSKTDGIKTVFDGHLTVVSGDGECVANELRPRGRSKGKNADCFQDQIENGHVVLRNQGAGKQLPPAMRPLNPALPKDTVVVYYAGRGSRTQKVGRLLSASEHAQRQTNG